MLLMKQNDRPLCYLGNAFYFIFSSSHLYYRNTQFFILAMPLNMIIAVYVIPCILSYDFNKLTILYIHVHTSLSFL